MGLSRYASRLAAALPRTDSPSPIKPNPGLKPNPDLKLKLGPAGSSGSFSSISGGISTGSEAHLHEPEDARLTGGTRSLSRRLLGLNLPSMPQPASIPASSLSPGAAVAGTKARKKSRSKRPLSTPIAAV